jgi:predicted small metal-binding protein
MATVYLIACKDLGVDCPFSARGGTHEEVIERCADHGRAEHNMRSFPAEMYAKMRSAITTAEEEAAP